jgi:hypothetical protein
VLGSETVNALEDYIRVQAARDVKEQTARTMGGLVAGQLKSSIYTIDLAKGPKHIKYWFLSLILTSPLMRKFVLKPGRVVDPTTINRAILISAPTIEAAFEDFGQGPGMLAIETLGRAFGMVEGDGRAEQRQEPETVEEFLNGAK